MLLALVAFGVLLQGFWLEPRQLLLRDEVDLDLRPVTERHRPARTLRLVHLSDLHVRGELPVLRRLLDALRFEEPDVVVVSGDLISGSRAPATMEERTARTAALLTEIRRIAPVLAVQGHSEYQGEVVAAFQQAGLRWLSNEGVELVPDGPLLLGLNQQVGWDALPGADGRLHLETQRSFEMVSETPTVLGVVREGIGDNLYLHWDPQVQSDGTASERARTRARTDGPLSWSGYELSCELRIDSRHAGAGVVLHSRYVVGEDRMLRLRRVTAGARGSEASGSFVLVPHGTAFTDGQPDTGVVPEPGRWYRVRVRTEVETELETEVGTETVRVHAKVWPTDAAEPAEWQAWAEDRSPTRVTAGTVGLWGWEEGGVAYRNLRVQAGDEVLLDEAFTAGAPGARPPAGWREGTRGSRLELALARSPEPAPSHNAPRIVLSHTPGVVLEAAHRGMEAVLAGHTHGGQVRLPVLGALTTRSMLGAYYDRGVFHFGSTSRRGWTTLHLSSGIGTSILPVRTFNPPRYAVLQVFWSP